jgi:pimeloyl-ACP methyl ester carboxylesterase
MSAGSWAEWRARSRPLDVGGRSVATYELGRSDARTLTFLHGYPSSSHDIEAVALRLGDRWRILALDFPGFGASDKPTSHTYSISACADAIEAMWSDRGVAATVLVAHDYGVSVGQELLARRRDGVLPVEVDAVVWMNGGLYPDLHRPTVGQQMLLDDETGAEVAATLTDDLFDAGIAVTWGQRVPMDHGDIHEMWRSMDERGGTALIRDLLHYVADRRANEARWRDALEHTTLPQTFVWGDLDPVSGAHMIERVEGRIPKARVIRLADVGHWPLLEAPDEVVAAIDALG